LILILNRFVTVVNRKMEGGRRKFTVGFERVDIPYDQFRCSNLTHYTACQDDSSRLSFLILGLLVDYVICQEISVNPAQSAPRSGYGVDRHFLSDSL